MDIPVFNILWTGGLDSTFRICELSRCACYIQPYYIDGQRKSAVYEKKAMSRIVKLLRDDKKTISQVADPIIVNEQIPVDPTIESAWKDFSEKYNLGTQYMSLASYSQTNNLVLELGLEYSSRNKAVKAISKEGG